MIKPKMSATVSVVKLSDSVLEFFKTNTRQSIKIKVENDDILKLVLSLDGSKNLDEISKENNIDIESLSDFIHFLAKNGLLDHVVPSDDFIQFDEFRRPIYFLNDYAKSHENLLDYWNKLINATVMVIGLGAVGSWVVCNLVQSGVRKFILIDPDRVDISNLHRQFGFSENQVGAFKVDAMEERLKKYNPSVNVIKCYEFLDETMLNQFDDLKIDLMINCADHPNVDLTSRWVGEYGMKQKIPHIVGGGYNLHLSLIGETVIPGKTACVRCFEKQLQDENKIDKKVVKKMMVKNRKIGSFGPMCSLIASMIGMEAIKVITGCTKPANINRRGEFNIYTMDITYHNYSKIKECEWCGEKGKYRDYRG